MGGHPPGQIPSWGTAADPLAGRDAGCMFRGRLPGRQDTHQASPSRQPRAHSVLRRDVISA
jgi:hypothetical protein